VPPPDAYFICATPRTGSTLLCGLLASSGVAGRPESYFRAQDMGLWAARWGLPPGAPFAGYLRAARAAGRGGGGPFAARVMWGTMAEVVQGIARPGGRDMDALTQEFGACRFVYLRRQDTVAQAVSLLRAEQTGRWHTTQAPAPTGRARYDCAALRARVAEMEAHSAAWAAWFRANGIAPHALTYEALARDPEGGAREVLRFLGLPAAMSLHAPTRRMADAVSADWAARYRAEMGFDAAQHTF